MLKTKQNKKQKTKKLGRDAVLDSRTLGSCPEPKADTQQLIHPGVPKVNLPWQLNETITVTSTFDGFKSELQWTKETPLCPDV